jgi:hypothetical protein
MKIILTFLCLCFSVHAQLALNNAFYNQFLNRNNGVNYGYFLQEDFEAPGYENVWTQAGSGTINDQCNNPPCPLLGSDSLRLALAGDNRRTTNAFLAAHSTVYGFAMIYFDARPNDREFFGFWNGSTRLVSFGVESGTDVLWFDDGTVKQSIGPIAADTLYYFWFRYTAGTGANAVYEVALSTDINNKPSSGSNYRLNTAGVATLDANRFVIGATAGVATYIFVTDHIRLSVNDIGANPN